MKKKTVIISSVTVVVLVLIFFIFLKGKGNKEVQFNTAQVN